jgi:hypothetical protein
LRAGRGKIGDRKLEENIIFIFFGRGKIGDFFFKLFFWKAGRWKIRGKEHQQLYKYCFLKHIFFGGLVGGKSATKN